MIKNFLDEEEEDSLITTRSFDKKPADENEFEEFAAPFSKIEDSGDLPEIPQQEVSAPDISNLPDTSDEPLISAAVLESPNEMPTEEFANRFSGTSPVVETVNETAVSETDNLSKGAAKGANAERKTDEGYEIFSQSPYHSESSDETIRRSGLAYAAAIILFGSIVFTLIVGWFADLLLGTSPWGKVGGIILGAVIGFVQFFRTTSQILKNKD